MSLVWDNFPRGGSDMLAMLAMADWCNDQGGSLHPSIASVAKKIRLTEKQARVIVHRLIDEGWLAVIGNENGGNPGQSRQYKLNVSKIATPPAEVSPPADVTPPVEVTPPVDVTPPVEVRDPSRGGSFTPPAHGSLTTIEPPIEPPVVNPLPPETADDKFLTFWNAYPKKVGKEAARKVWIKIKSPAASLDAILIALAWQSSTDQWTKNNGQYIPNPATYLTQQRWLDERPTTPPQPKLTAVGQKSANAASRWLDSQGFNMEKTI